MLPNTLTPCGSALETTKYCLMRRMRFWRYENAAYRSINIVLFLLTRISIPVLSALVALSVHGQTMGNSILTPSQMVWSGVVVIFLSTIDTTIRPAENKQHAFRRIGEMTEMELCFEIEYARASDDDIKAQVLAKYVSLLKDHLLRYGARGWGI